jgi:hypothetical protein
VIFVRNLNKFHKNCCLCLDLISYLGVIFLQINFNIIPSPIPGIGQQSSLSNLNPYYAFNQYLASAAAATAWSASIGGNGGTPNCKWQGIYVGQHELDQKKHRRLKENEKPKEPINHHRPGGFPSISHLPSFFRSFLDEGKKMPILVVAFAFSSGSWWVILLLFPSFCICIHPSFSQPISHLFKSIHPSIPMWPWDYG